MSLHPMLKHRVSSTGTTQDTGDGSPGNFLLPGSRLSVAAWKQPMCASGPPKEVTPSRRNARKTVAAR